MIVFDTETTGIHNARIVQLAAALLDDELNIVQQVCLLVDPGQCSMDERAFAAHGITLEHAQKYGVPEKHALSVFNVLVRKASTRVAHNQQFDDGVMRAAFARSGVACETFSKMTQLCTMEVCTPLVKHPPTEKMIAAGFDKYKNASVAESYAFCYGKPMPYKAHDALGDVLAVVDILRWLRENGHV